MEENLAQSIIGFPVIESGQKLSCVQAIQVFRF